jgi:acyl carrier protein
MSAFMNTIETIKRIIVTMKALPGLPSDLSDHTDLIDDIGLDSIELLNFMLELEAQLRIRIDFDRMEFSMLSSIATLGAFLDTMPSTRPETAE